MKDFLPIYCLLVWALVCPASWGDDGVLTLEQAVKETLSYNRDLLSARLNTATSRQRLRQAKAEFDFSIRPDGRANAGDDREDLAYGLGLRKRFSIGTDVNALARYRLVSDDTNGIDQQESLLRVELSQPLFRNAGRLINLEPVVAGKQRVLAAERMFEVRKADLVLQTSEQFHAVKISERRLQIDLEAVDRLSDLARLTVARERQSGGGSVDRLRTDLQVGQAQVRVANTREQLIADRQELADLLGRSPEDFSIQLAPAELSIIELPDMEAAYRIALSNRLDYAQILQEYEDAGRKEHIVRKSVWPDIRLTTAYEIRGVDEGFSNIRGSEDDDWFAGLTIGSDFNKTREKADIAIAGTEVELARIGIRDTEFRIARQVRDRLAGCRRSQAEYEISKRNAILARDRLKLARRLYTLGRGTNFDVVEAQDALVSTELQKHESRADVSIATFRLLHAMGCLVDHPLYLKPGAVGEDGT